MPINAGADADHSALRLGIGVGAAFLLGILVGWPLAFLGSVFVALFLQAPAPVPPRATVALIVAAFVIMAASWLGVQVLLAYPLLFLMALTAALFLTFHYAARGGSPMMVVLLLLALLLMPSILRSSPELAGTVAVWLILNIGIGLAVSNTMFLLFPPGQAISVPATAASAPAPAIGMNAHALRMTLITAPFATVFYSFEFDAVLTLIFIAFLAQQLNAATGAAAARGLLAANFIGGFTALVAYELVVMAPNLAFMAMLSLALILMMSKIRMSGAAYAPLAGSVLTAFLVLYGGAMAPFGDDVDAKFGDRLTQIAAAALYVAAAFYVINAFTLNKETPDPEAAR